MCFQEPPAAKPKAMSKARKFIVDTGQPYFRGVQKIERTQANLGSRGGFHEPPGASSKGQAADWDAKGHDSFCWSKSNHFDGWWVLGCRNLLRRFWPRRQKDNLLWRLTRLAEQQLHACFRNSCWSATSLPFEQLLVSNFIPLRTVAGQQLHSPSNSCWSATSFPFEQLLVSNLFFCGYKDVFNWYCRMNRCVRNRKEPARRMAKTRKTRGERNRREGEDPGWRGSWMARILDDWQGSWMIGKDPESSSDYGKIKMRPFRALHRLLISSLSTIDCWAAIHPASQLPDLWTSAKELFVVAHADCRNVLCWPDLRKLLISNRVVIATDKPRSLNLRIADQQSQRLWKISDVYRLLISDPSAIAEQQSIVHGK